VKLKQGCSIYSDYGLNISAEQYSEEGVPIIRTSDVDNSGALDLSNTKFVEPHVVGTKRLRKGDVLFSRSGTIGRAMVFNADVAATYAAYLVRFRPHPKRLLSKFIGYWAQSSGYWNQIGADTIQSTIGNFNANKFANLSIPEYDLATQRQIADFLDRETARIDLLIEKKQKLVNLLGEKATAFREAHIASGALTRIKFFSEYITSGSRDWGDLYADDGELFVRIGNVSGKGIDLDLRKKTFVDLGDRTEGLRTRLRVADLLVSITADLGSVAVVGNEAEGAYINQHLALVRLRQSMVDPRYVAHAMITRAASDQFALRGYGGTKQGLSLKDVAEIAIPVPPKDAQVRIVRQVDDHISRQSATNKKIDASIVRLQEYRSALITAAVTGQIDVQTYGKSGATDLRLDAIQEELGA
jgi:type I restriction enzyme, S subunit